MERWAQKKGKSSSCVLEQEDRATLVQGEGSSFVYTSRLLWAYQK